ncbi:MAG: PAS domain S-box protein [Chloroflexi bacterium]|nr:PAS domain S-box protein [Chloroflexota bacterium]
MIVLGARSEETSVGQVPMERLRTIFDGMFDGVWLVGGDGCTTYANEAIAGMLGTTPGAMHGRPITDFLSQEFRAVAEALIDGQRASSGERVDLRFLRANGDDLWTLVAASPITTAEGSYVGSMLNVSDVTGKRAAQNQALQNQKLEAIGGFAAGISHDFNNLLTSIRGFAELAAAAIPATSVAREDLERVIVSADCARQITGKLLAFTRHQILTPVPADAAQVIADMLPILQPLVSDDIEIELESAATGAWILVDPVALEQILVNLAINARDAMPNGGHLRIAIDEVEPRGRQALGADGHRPASVRIRITDSGIGMDEKTVAHIFDPFFTTKDIGKGTGLGLSTVYGLISQMHGEIEVVSELGSGSTFSILLPLMPASPDMPAMTPLTRRRSPRTAKPGVVLMVEDNTSVREFARRVLAGAGHTALTASDANAALDTASHRIGTIDVLLTDVVMPGMRGPVLAAKIRELRPDISVIYMSGYAAEALPGLDGLAPSATFLSKPFTAANLLDAVARGVAVGHKRAVLHSREDH